MRDVLLNKEIRLKNLQYLVFKSDILQKGFAKLVATGPNTFNQYMTGNRSVGDRMARKVEERLKLGRGWMDQSHPEEWEEMANTNYDGRAKSRSASRNALTIAIRLEALNEKAQESIMEMIELYEAKQAREDGLLPLLPKSKLD